jgi:PleD family two-component response regulator
LTSTALPAESSSHEAPHTTLAASALQTGDVLIVDDDQDILRAMAELLAGYGFTVTVAASLEDALTVLAAASRPSRAHLPVPVPWGLPS